MTRIGNDEGSLTVSYVKLLIRRAVKETLLNRFRNLRLFAWLEGRALLGSNLSAMPGTEAKGGVVCRRGGSPRLLMPFVFGSCDKPS